MRNCGGATMVEGIMVYEFCCRTIQKKKVNMWMWERKTWRGKEKKGDVQSR